MNWWMSNVQTCHDRLQCVDYGVEVLQLVHILEGTLDYPVQLVHDVVCV